MLIVFRSEDNERPLRYRGYSYQRLLLHDWGALNDTNRSLIVGNVWKELQPTHQAYRLPG
jgi:hypothetical protein